MAIHIQLRRDLAFRWYDINPIMVEGEIGLETDSRKFKIGTGFTPWRDLPYGGLQGPQGIFPIAASLEIQWAEEYPSNHTEVTYQNGLVTAVDVWDSAAKAVHVFSKVFVYDSNFKIMSVTITRFNGSKMTKAIGYDANGNITTVDRVYTP